MSVRTASSASARDGRAARLTTAALPRPGLLPTGLSMNPSPAEHPVDIANGRVGDCSQ
jgi:hypothetical protein